MKQIVCKTCNVTEFQGHKKAGSIRWGYRISVLLIVFCVLLSSCASNKNKAERYGVIAWSGIVLYYDSININSNSSIVWYDVACQCNTDIKNISFRLVVQLIDSNGREIGRNSQYISIPYMRADSSLSKSINVKISESRAREVTEVWVTMSDVDVTFVKT